MMNSADTLKVLLVEDNPGDARLVEVMLLEQPSCQIDYNLSTSLASAIERLAEGDFDICLLDLSLPDSEGLDTINAVRASAASIPIIVLTGLESEEAALEAMQYGAQDYLVKGRDDGSQIVRAVRYAIERHRVDLQGRQYAIDLHKALIETVTAISTTLEKRDPYTAGHQHRVAQLARAIGQEMGLSEGELEGLYFGGLIHDLGKVAIPGELLARPGHLSELERELIKTHPQQGYEIIKDVQFPWPIAEMVFQHHEHIDGSGYPRGLEGDEIILEARILSVADVVEAVSSHRPYRASLGIEQALEEIERHVERYAPEVVATCLKLFRDKGFTFET